LHGKLKEKYPLCEKICDEWLQLIDKKEPENSTII
jgi:hypothetical protein